MSRFNTAEEIVKGLRRHFLSSDNYDEVGCYGEIFTTELTLPDTRRRADAVYMSLMESRGMSIDVVEIKVSHADFRSELSDPSKAESFFHYSSRFWIAAPNEDVAPPEMLPPGWGLLLPPKRSNGKTWQVAVEPSVRQPEIDLKFLGMITNRLRNVSMNSWNKMINSHEQSLRDARSQGRKEAADERTLTPDHTRALNIVQSLERHLGQSISDHYWRRSEDGFISPLDLVAAYNTLGHVPGVGVDNLRVMMRNAQSALRSAEEMNQKVMEAAKLLGMEEA